MNLKDLVSLRDQLSNMLKRINDLEQEVKELKADKLPKTLTLPKEKRAVSSY